QRDELAAANAEGDVAYRLDGGTAELERLTQSPDVDAPGVTLPARRHRRQAFHVQAGYAFFAASIKVGATRSVGVSGLIPVISRNQTFSPRCHAAASMVPS